MKEVTIINEFKALWNSLQNGLNGMKIHATGEALRAQALQALLLKKAVFTEEELAAALSAEIQKMNASVDKAAKAAEEKASKPEIILPNTAQVAAVTETKDAAPETVIEKPQA